MNLEDMTLDIEQHIDVQGPIDEVFKRVLYRLGKGNMLGDGASMQMNLEEWAGGRHHGCGRRRRGWPSTR